MNIGDYIENVTEWLVKSGPKILLVIAVTAVAVFISRALIRKVFSLHRKAEDEEFQKRRKTLSSVISKTVTIIILLIALIMVLGLFGLEIGPILAAAGVLGLAIGFGAQHLVSDVLNGFFLLLDDQIRVGDVVSIADKAGVVESINLRVTVLRDLSGNVHFVRNGKIDIVTNMTKNFSMYVFDIGVAYRENVDEVIELIKQVDEQMRNDPDYSDDILASIEVLGLDKFADSAVIIKARTKTKPLRQWAIGREFNRRLKQKFDQEGIEIPFPHLTVYMGQDKKGASAPLNIAVTNKPAKNS